MQFVLPPRPNAIATVLDLSRSKEKNDADSGATMNQLETLLYSMRRSVPKPCGENDGSSSSSVKIVVDNYPPEILLLILTSENDSQRDDVERIKERVSVFGVRTVSTSNSERGENVETPLFLLRQESYHRILYVSLDCLVIRDVSSLLREDDDGEDAMMIDGTTGVLAACSRDGIEKERDNDDGAFGFANRSVLLLGPNSADSTSSAEELVRNRGAVVELPARSYNVLARTTGKTVGATSHTRVLNLSEASPWKRAKGEKDDDENDPARKYWSRWYESGQTYARKRKERIAATANAKTTKERSSPSSSSRTPKSKSTESHKKVSSRYKELRSAGVPVKEAMLQARTDCGDTDDVRKASPGAQVASMFGIQS